MGGSVRRLGPAALAAALSLAACGGGEPAGERTPSPPPIKDLERRLTLTVRGTIDLTFRGTQTMRVYAVAAGAPGIPTVAAVSTGDPIPYAPGRGIEIGISVAGTYTGDGTYSIGPTSPGAGRPELTAVGALIYDLVAEPPRLVGAVQGIERACTVTLRAEATEGSATCSAVTDGRGERISIRMTWGPPLSSR